jgi:beta-lactamase family protein
MLADRLLLTPARPEPVGLSTERLGRISRRLQMHIEAGDICGAVTAVARRGQLVHLETHGHTALDRTQPMQPDSIFRLASMTKPVTAVAVLMLFEEGLVRLDDPAAAYIPELRGLSVGTDDSGKYAVPAAREITLRDLLSHTSGLGSAPAGTPLAVAVRQARAEVGLHGAVGDFMPRLKTIPISFQPGTAWSYSGVGGFDVLGRMVEVISGQTLDHAREPGCRGVRTLPYRWRSAKRCVHVGPGGVCTHCRFTKPVGAEQPGDRDATSDTMPAGQAGSREPLSHSGTSARGDAHACTHSRTRRSLGRLPRGSAAAQTGQEAIQPATVLRRTAAAA